MSARAGSHLSLSANVCSEEPADVYLNWTRVSSCQYLSSEFNKCLPEVFPNVCRQSFWRDHLMSFRINPMSSLSMSVWWVWSMSSWAGSHLSLSANVCSEEPADVYLDWTLVFLANIFLGSSISVCLKCFPTSVANLSEGITWCLPGSTQCLSCLRLSDGFDQCLSELILTLFLSANVC